MQVDSVEFEAITTPLPTDWVMRLVIRGSELDHGAIPMAAEIGPQKVHGLMPTTEEGVTLGFLTRVPDAGDELRIGYADGPLTPTGITFEPPTA
jgi:hypothetical protein